MVLVKPEHIYFFHKFSYPQCPVVIGPFQTMNPRNERDRG